MWLKTYCNLKFEIEHDTPLVMMLRPRSDHNQWITKEEYRITPCEKVIEFTDNYGNLCQRLVAKPGKLEIKTSAKVRVPKTLPKAPGAPFVEVQKLPHDTLQYLLPSRYCESDRFGQMAAEITQNCIMGYDQVAEIENWIRTNFTYDPGSSIVPLSAVEVNAKDYAVCRDMAHLGIALCRGISIPARIVVGYLHELEPMDLHAWFEAYVGGEWYTFDATQTKLKGGYVAIGYGRDAADVAIYNQFGPLIYHSTQTIRVEAITE